jgi:hypothetical protein
MQYEPSCRIVDRRYTNANRDCGALRKSWHNVHIYQYDGENDFSYEMGLRRRFISERDRLNHELGLDQRREKSLAGSAQSKDINETIYINRDSALLTPRDLKKHPLHML